MLVSVIILINLLIAMMSDTYQSIQSQSDIEWKYGLSKLIRSMQKTQTAPSPLNLLTTWIEYFLKLYKKRRSKKKRMSVMHGFVKHSNVLRRNEKKKSLIALSGNKSPIGSQQSIKRMPNINDVIDWNLVRKKYRMRFGDVVEKPSSSNSLTEEINL
ncbi:transient-receptor-potential-like protein [Microplitis demolitor]|uniref:transient-receptor-potential-like protein n=1 Tax=Microplitis demolitor TaxID=69319 RepID=UPI00235B6DBD|nr:transient-receptor-potential-like protein [Microplitis demolitor]